VIVEHVFEVHDWGGEHMVDAVRELMLEDVHGLLIVVDLGGENARQVEADRVHEQLQEFNPRVLRYFFGSETVASCKTAVLFINKSDLLAGTPAQVEEQAKKLYAPLIESLHKYSPQIDIRVFVGSASYGHSTHLLFSHFVERILPSSAYDAQLLQQMKSGFSDPGPSSTGSASGGAAAQPVSAPALPAPGPVWTPPPSPAAGRGAAMVRAKITIPMHAPQAPSIPHGD
jgi:hypothetical protein